VFQVTGSGTLFTNLGFQRTGSGTFLKFRVSRNRFWNPFYKFNVPRNRFWNPFSKLGFFPEPVPRTLQNLWFLKVPEQVLVPAKKKTLNIQSMRQVSNDSVLMICNC
jgi:hypothetical protein